MLQGPRIILIISFLAVQFCLNSIVNAQITSVGSGSYTNTFPGVDVAGRNTYPSGTPQISGTALGKPVPTNDWWSALIKNNHAGNLFNYPMALKTTNPGLVVSYIPWGVYDDQEPIIVGVSGLNATKATVADYSDWTVTMDWNDGSHNFQATSGIAMPFIYFTKGNSDVMQIIVNLGNVTISGEMLIVENARNDGDFVFYAPEGSTWSQTGSVYTSTLNNKNYWSMAMIPLTAINISTVAEEYKKYAYVFPSNTTTSWTYDEMNSVLRTDFAIETITKEGTETNILMGLMPHQWANLAADSPIPDKYSYSSVRGEIKTLEGNSFSVENIFRGILPTLPYLANYSSGFSPSELDKKVAQIENDGLASWTDSYNEGQVMNRMIQTARIADQMGNTEGRDKMIATVQERLEDWLTAEASEVAFLFFYNSVWSTMIGYPAGHGQDGNINDHHFHWGYFIHAAAFLEQFEPGWADQWGEMIDHLVRDAASANRNDDKFPFLRNFSPYAGHCWANGFATFPQGNDQESTSESMQFNSSLIHWGTITDNDEIRDLGIYLYTTEQTAIEEYWFDMHERNFSPTQQYSLVSRVWGNSYDNGTFWTGDIAASYGIEMYPIHGGSLYLGHNPDYVQKLWTEISANTGILSNEANDNLWHDVMWEYLSFIDPQSAIDLYNSYPERSLKFGISDAQTYHWIHAMNVLGKVSNTITADYPIAAAFDKEGTITYVAHNYSDSPVTVTYSDGFELQVPANQITTNKDIEAKGILSSDFTQAYTNGSVKLTVAINGEGVTKVEFFDGNTPIGTISGSPYEFRAENLSLGIHGLYAKIYVNEVFNVTNIVSVQVGEQIPYTGNTHEIPGVIEAGHYDKFEGGVGQGISYVDVSQLNEGGFRPDEYVDAIVFAQEGATVGWISAGEWMEYSIDVQTAGLYKLSCRLASGNSNGGGPFYFEIDGKKISPDIYVSSTGDWNSWTNKTVNEIELNKGEHILRLVISEGEFNLGKMTFEYSGALPYSPPVANAGDNVLVILPSTTATLNGSQSSDPEGQNLSYNWEQVYGPSIINFTDNTVVSPGISKLEEGVYKCRLTVDDGSYSSISYVLIIVSSSTNINPTVSITSPVDNSSYYEGSDISITASANDLDGSVSLVEFFDGELKIGEATTESYTYIWKGASQGSHTISAKATDNEGAIGISTSISIEVEPAPSCFGGSDNGDYTYEFSDDKDNPTITFIPGKSGTGSPICILYYGTNAPFPGYIVSPNTPYRINASEGELIHFYYTYSYDGMERNTSASKHSYVIGSCYIFELILTISDISFSIDENSSTNTIIGSPAITYNGDKPLTYYINSG
ncbi:glycosyl hydrolase, partial [Bacteroidota bacterium]